MVACGFIEIRMSVLQSWLFTRTNARISYELQPERSSSIAFPRHAPFDERRGYSKLPHFQSRLESQGYHITQQVHQSPTTVELIRRGIAPPYVEPPETGLNIHGADEIPLFHYAQSDFLFQKFDDIPPLLIQTLLYLENRDLGRPKSRRQNPAIEWERLLKATVLYTGSKLYFPISVQGGSTLAVQLEKFRHSPSGRTDTPLEKLRQVIGASLKAYRNGAETRAWRQRIIIDYLN
ncbi:MAG TPA: transglycosylase domain-containing protein, partial [Candidatus Binatia bacterium]|nr:transglycosylase domain-containing protein [Candidatus Binatia bacterium]